jgi:hypothetical protein
MSKIVCPQWRAEGAPFDAARAAEQGGPREAAALSVASTK